MKKYLVLGVGIILVGVIGYYGWQWNRTQMNIPSTSTSTPGQSGTTVQISGNLVRNNPGMKENAWFLVYDEPGAPGLKAELVFENGSECLRGQTGMNCKELDLPNGTHVTALGQRTDGQVVVKTLNIESPEEAVRITSPFQNDRVVSPLQIKGSARGNWFFEASFPIRLLVAGKLVTSTHASATSDWMTADFVPFTATLDFNVATDTPAEIVFMADNPSGLPQFEKEMRLPVTLVPRSATRTIDLYYYDPKKDNDASGNISCSAKGLVAVKRVVPRTASPLTDAIKLLLRGELTNEERAKGVTTEFPLSGVELTSAFIKDGVANLSFTDPDFKTSGGSCRVAVLWAQINATARQFPGIKEVKFSPPELFQP
jgi:hypothetical protein